MAMRDLYVYIDGNKVDVLQFNDWDELEQYVHDEIGSDIDKAVFSDNGNNIPYDDEYSKNITSDKIRNLIRVILDNKPYVDYREFEEKLVAFILWYFDDTTHTEWNEFDNAYQGTYKNEEDFLHEQLSLQDSERYIALNKANRLMYYDFESEWNEWRAEGYFYILFNGEHHFYAPI
jgi:hypothetical protein